MRISSRSNNKIKFNDDHINYTNKNGILVPSVTTILKVLAKDDALMSWSNNLGWKHKSYKKELENSSIIGTTAHSFCEYMIKQDDDLLSQIISRMSNFPVDLYTQTKNAIVSFKKWYMNNKDYLEVLYTELQLVSDKCGGTTDLVCNFKDKLMLIDYKTSSSFYMSQFLQLAQYAKMYSEKFNIKVDDVAVLRLDKKNGDNAQLLRLSSLPNGDLEYYQYVFDKLITLYNFNNVLNNDWEIYKSLINSGIVIE